MEFEEKSPHTRDPIKDSVGARCALKDERREKNFPSLSG
jgi:hypothetical protein